MQFLREHKIGGNSTGNISDLRDISLKITKVIMIKFGICIHWIMLKQYNGLFFLAFKIVYFRTKGNISEIFHFSETKSETN